MAMKNMHFYPILVEPEDPRNVGFVARVMKSYGFTELRIIHSKWASVPDAAYITGVSAPEILQSARFFDTVPQALADLQGAIAFSRRSLGDLPRVPIHSIQPSLPQGNRLGLLFGRESTGLHVDECMMCQMLCYIPSQNGVSLNLGQAVAVALQALYVDDTVAVPVLPVTHHSHNTQGHSKEHSEGAPVDFAGKQALKEFVLQKMDEDVDSETGLFLDRFLRNWNPDTREFGALFGILRKISK
jgi:TrmH family RNA methyltransferase